MIPTRSPGLLLAIKHSLEDRTVDAPDCGVLSAVVNGWYEGHIEAESTRRKPARASSEALAGLYEDAMPSPPFPDRNSEELREILDETRRRFELPACAAGAIAYGAGLGWAAGFREGTTCHGCSYRGPEPALGALFRDGIPLEALILLSERHPNNRTAKKTTRRKPATGKPAPKVKPKPKRSQRGR
jgi:hypothetical protein